MSEETKTLATELLEAAIHLNQAALGINQAGEKLGEVADRALLLYRGLGLLTVQVIVLTGLTLGVELYQALGGFEWLQ